MRLDDRMNRAVIDLKADIDRMSLPQPPASGRERAKGLGVVTAIGLLLCSATVGILVLGGGSGPVAEPDPTTTSPPTTSPESWLWAPMRSENSLSVLDGPEYGEFGGWWHVPHVTLVVRGTIVDMTDLDDYWLTRTLRVDEVLLGSAPGIELTMLSTRPNDFPFSSAYGDSDPLAVGTEGIYFLVPRLQHDVMPEAFAFFLGASGVVTENLDYWVEHLPKARDILGSARFQWSRPEYLIEANVLDLSPPDEMFNWEYVEATLTDVGVKLNDMGVPLENTLRVLFPSDRVPEIGSTVEVPITHIFAPEPLGLTWFAVPDADMELDRETQREPYMAAQARATDLLRSLVATVGRMPLSHDRDRPYVDMTELMMSPLIVKHDGYRVVFEYWPFRFMGPGGAITISRPDGSTLDGEFGREDSNMRIGRTTLEFLEDDGSVIFTMPKSVLDEAQRAAWIEFMNLPDRTWVDPGRVPRDADVGELYRSPLTIETGTVSIVFTMWPGTVMDGTSRVSVFDPSGMLLLEGPAEGPDSVWRDKEGGFEFVDGDGNVVATMTHEHLNGAMNEAYEEFFYGD